MDTDSPWPAQSPLFSPYTLIAGGTFTQVLGNYNDYRGAHGFTPLVKGGFERLQEACASSAFHDSGDTYDRPKCHPNTRVAVLQYITGLIAGRRQSALKGTSPPTSFIFLTGPAGAGKSAIASTIAGRCYDEGKLLASFFFRLADQTKNSVRPFFATIAYQVCLALPYIQDDVVAAIERDPLLFKKGLSVQFNTLLVNPLLHLLNRGLFNVTSGPYCIVIDGLDECIDRKARCELLEVLAVGIARTGLPLVFLVACRPEHDITSVITSQNLAQISQRIYLDWRYLPDADIRLYLLDSFQALRMNHPSKDFIPQHWPSDKIIDELVYKASGQFIYATTVLKYISSSRHNPMKRLELLFDLHSDHMDTPFAELDALYTQILSGVEDIDSLLRILSFFQLNDGYWNLDYVLIMLQQNIEDVMPLLSDLGSLLDVQMFSIHRTKSMFVHVLHASFMDFLCDRRRSGRYYLDFTTWRTHYMKVAFLHLSNYTQDQNIFKAVLALNFITMNLGSSFTQSVIFHCLSEFSVKRLYETIYPHPTLFIHFTGFVTVILHFLETLNSPLVFPIYGMHLQAFEKCLRSGRLAVYYQDQRLQFFITILGYASQCTAARRITIFHPKAQLFDVSEELLEMDRYGLLLFETLDDTDRDFRIFLGYFLGDSARSGDYALRGLHYAQSALYCLKFIQNFVRNFTHHTPSSIYHSRRRRNTPWLSRTFLPKKDPLHRLYRMTGVQGNRLLLLRMFTLERRLDREWTLGNDPPISSIQSELPATLERQTAAYRDFLRLGMALRYLPYLLRRSSMLDELEVLARRMVFPLAAFGHQEKLARARKAIVNYLNGEYAAYDTT
ncbi:hypothetical protein CPC08DRAFT_708969 [Agrocybe pediades]|nr:hypothetical protein CPC08DRAFT_708969 [Agrocybe pediades]